MWNAFEVVGSIAIAETLWRVVHVPLVYSESLASPPSVGEEPLFTSDPSKARSAPTQVPPPRVHHLPLAKC